MRREKRPFVVEVKRGQKRPGFASGSETKPESEKVKVAEAALFGGESAVARTLPERRILEALSSEPVEPEIELPRRGRKPGSKNKPKPETVSDRKSTRLNSSH